MSYVCFLVKLQKKFVKKKSNSRVCFFYDKAAEMVCLLISLLKIFQSFYDATTWDSKLQI